MRLNKALSAIVLTGTLTFSNIANAIEVLTSSARDYVESVGKKLSDYDMKGLDASNFIGYCSSALLRKAPENTEAIVDYRAYLSNILLGTSILDICMGTALIPKNDSLR